MQNQAPGISEFHQNINFHFEAGFGCSTPSCVICAGYRPQIRSVCHVPTYHGLYQQPMDVLENAGTCAKSYSSIGGHSWKATIASWTTQRRHHFLRLLDTRTLLPRLGTLFSSFFSFFQLFFQFFSEFSGLISYFQALFPVFRPYFRFSGLIFNFQA